MISVGRRSRSDALYIYYVRSTVLYCTVLPRRVSTEKEKGLHGQYSTVLVGILHVHLIYLLPVLVRGWVKAKQSKGEERRGEGGGKWKGCECNVQGLLLHTQHVCG